MIEETKSAGPLEEGKQRRKKRVRNGHDAMVAFLLLLPMFPAMPFFALGYLLGKIHLIQRCPEVVFWLFMAPPCLVGLIWPLVFLFFHIGNILSHSHPPSNVDYWSFMAFSPIWLAGLPAGVLFRKLRRGNKWVPVVVMLGPEIVALLFASMYLFV